MSGRGGKKGNPPNVTARSKLWKTTNNSKNSVGRNQTPRGNYVTHRDLHGGKITPPANPPDVTYQPWMTVTLVQNFNSSSYDFKVNTILGILRRQLDPEGRGFNQSTSGDKRFVVQMRIHSIQAWNLTGRMLALSVDDFSESTSAAGGRDQLCGIVDTGSQNHTPCVGYLLPSSHRQMVLRTDDKQGDDFIFTVTSGASDQCIVYIKISFRFDGPSKLPSIQTPLGHCINLLSSTRRVVTSSNQCLTRMDEVLARLKEISENTYANRPSILKKLVEGIEMAVMAVAIPAADMPSSSYSDLADELDHLDIQDHDEPRPASSQ